MSSTTLALGSIEALHAVMREGALVELKANADVVVVPTAAAFTGIAEAALAIAQVLDDFDLHVEALMVADRTAATEPYFSQRLFEADLVILCDGSSLHARSVWRATPLGQAINASLALFAIGGVASVLGDVMIDPRGGAPTTGLGYRPGLAICTPASEEQLTRTRSLLGADVPLALLGPAGVVRYDGTQWQVLSGDVIVTRGHETSVL